jgi:hypothetical protein
MFSANLDQLILFASEIVIDGYEIDEIAYLDGKIRLGCADDFYWEVDGNELVDVYSGEVETTDANGEPIHMTFRVSHPIQPSDLA